jgi:DNA-directed RNA polymerase specialized sigma24 family protein
MTAEEYQTEAERITPQLRQTALRYMGDASLSEDIAQDVLLRLWQLLDELRTPMDGLALTMVRNECLMRLRKQPRTVGMEGHDMAEQPSVNPMAELTLSMLDKLPPTSARRWVSNR